MKRVVIAVVVSVMFLTTAAAQNRPNTEQRQQPTVEQMAQNRTDRMAQMLSLDDKQKEQLYKLNLKTLKKQQGAREKASKLMEQAKDEARSDTQRVRFVAQRHSYGPSSCRSTTSAR